MIIVTGGAGFIGANLIKGLNQKGINDIVVIDNLKNGKKFVNLVGLDIADYYDKSEWLEKVQKNDLPFDVQAIFHQGACSVTTEWDGHYMMENNYRYSKSLLEFALNREIPFIYASSAAVYGANTTFKETPEFEQPINVYGYSKLLFDNVVRREFAKAKSQIFGTRYFNVYGPGETHKGSMASVAYHLTHQIQQTGKVKLFGAWEKYGAGEQCRDFVYIDDVISVLLWAFESNAQSGIYNVGTGRSQSFNDVAHTIVKAHGKGEIEYIDFPEHLKGAYQSFTQADITLLREAGYQGTFRSVEEGAKQYYDLINANSRV